MKRTRQGVRDLNDIPAKRNTKRMADLPPKDVQVVFCRHPSGFEKRLPSGDTYCNLCGQQWDWNGMPY